MNQPKTSRLVAAAVAALVAAAPAIAAENDVLEEVVVTAEKRSSTVQDTPISIAAFSGAELESAGITTTDGLSNLTPGLEIGRAHV